MKKALIASLALTVSLPAVSRAAPPDCAQHLQEPGADGRLSQEQLDANNACLNIVETQKKISEGLAAIADNERRTKNGGAAYQAPAVRNDSASAHMPFPQQRPLAMPRPDMAPSGEKAESSGPKASVDGVMWEGGNVITGFIRLPDGQSLEAMKGTTLPDGSVVTTITQSGTVIVTRDANNIPCHPVSPLSSLPLQTPYRERNNGRIIYPLEREPCFRERNALGATRPAPISAHHPRGSTGDGHDRLCARTTAAQPSWLSESRR